MTKWTIANTALSEVVHSANEAGPQLVIEDGKEVAVVVSMEDWKATQASESKLQSGASNNQSVYDALFNSHLIGSDLEIPDRSSWNRVIDLSE